MRLSRRFLRGFKFFFLSGAIALLFTLLVPPQAALAHPLDVYLQASYITVSPSEIVVELDLSPGVLVVPQVLPQLDANNDQQISEAEEQSYVDSILKKLVLKVDGQSLSLAVTRIDMPEYLTLQAGYGTIRVFTAARLVDSLEGTHAIDYINNYTPKGSAYQVNTFVDQGVSIKLAKQNRDSLQQSIHVAYTIGSTPSATSVSPALPASNPNSGTTSLETSLRTSSASSSQVRQLLDYLQEPSLSPWALLFALGLAGVLGGLHALTPGHGKTLVAAYLVGSRGTVRHAISLGAIVTFTHTFSVVLIGLLALFASQFVVPDVLVPVMEILSGLLVVFLGGRLAWQRWTAFRNCPSPQRGLAMSAVHRHNYVQLHPYVDGQIQGLRHDHGDGHSHSHPVSTEEIKLSNLLALGISGGLLPCPEALGIMVIAIGLNRILLGMGLIVSFSFGLAAILILIGILLVRSRSLLERFGALGSRWGRALPLVSALIVTVLGVAIALKGLVSYLG